LGAEIHTKVDPHKEYYPHGKLIQFISAQKTHFISSNIINKTLVKYYFSDKVI